VATKVTTRPASQDARIIELEAENARLKEDNQSKGDSETKIELDELISVMSLLNYTLNLSTLGFGKGKNVKFESFGEMKRVLYQDLLDIMETSRSFMENGLFIILDARVIKRHGLQDIYKKILTKEKIDLILSGSKSAVELYKSSNPEQQNIIVGMIVERLRDNPEGIDLNVVDKLSRVSGVNISQKTEDARAFFKREVVEAGA